MSQRKLIESGVAEAVIAVFGVCEWLIARQLTYAVTILILLQLVEFASSGLWVALRSMRVRLKLLALVLSGLYLLATQQTFQV